MTEKYNRKRAFEEPKTDWFSKFIAKLREPVEVLEFEDYDGDDETGRPIKRKEFVCSNCMKRVRKGEKYCSHCGRKLK